MSKGTATVGKKSGKLGFVVIVVDGGAQIFRREFCRMSDCVDLLVVPSESPLGVPKLTNEEKLSVGVLKQNVGVEESLMNGDVVTKFIIKGKHTLTLLLSRKGCTQDVASQEGWMGWSKKKTQGHITIFGPSEDGMVVNRAGDFLLVTEIGNDVAGPGSVQRLEMIGKVCIRITVGNNGSGVFSPQLIGRDVNATLNTMVMEFPIKGTNTGGFAVRKSGAVLVEELAIDNGSKNSTIGQDASLVKNRMPVVVTGNGCVHTLLACRIGLKNIVDIGTFHQSHIEQTTRIESFVAFQDNRGKKTRVENCSRE